MVSILIFLAALVAYLFYKFVYKPHQYWKQREVHHNKPWLFFGDMGRLIFGLEGISESTERVYNSFPSVRYFGIYQFLTPILSVKDLELVKQITVKDFDHFHDHKQAITEEQDILFGKSLPSLKGEKWRNMRATLSPAFTSSKMKSMFVLISEAAEQFTQYFVNKDQSTVNTVSMKEVFTKYANDVIATTAFGLKCNSLENENNEFFTMGKDISNVTIGRLIKFFIFFISPKIFVLLRLQLFPKSLNTFFRKIVKEAIDAREQQGIIRPDMLHLLMEARKGRLKNENQHQNTLDAGFASVEESTLGIAKQELTDDDITAQALLFFLAGFSTASTLLCFMSYELAANPDIQKKLQKEIDETMEKSCNGKISYDALLKMKYLDMTVCETLRKWPPAIAIEREVVKDYTITPVNPNEKPLRLEVGNQVMISVLGIQRDPKYFPNPMKFDPERYSNENKENIIPGSYIPFGVGPRNCIGSRFALLEIKAIIAHFLSKFDIVIVEKTKVPPNYQFNLDDFILGLKCRK